MSKFKQKLGAFIKGDKLTSGVITAVIIVIVIALNVALYAVDITLYRAVAVDDLTITGNTDMLFSEERVAGRKITVTFCQTSDEMVRNDYGKYVLQTAEQMADRYSAFLEIRFANIITKTVVNRDGSRAEDINILDYQKDKDAEGNPIPIGKSAVLFQCGDNFKLLNDTYSPNGYADFYTLDSSYKPIAYHGEEVFASMMSWVLEDEHKTAYLTTYHGEMADIALYTMLTCAGYNVEPINLREREVPADAGLLVVSNPKQDFERAKEDSGVRTDIERMRTYLENGGNVYIALDPYAGEFRELERFIGEFGIQISSTRTQDGKFYRNIVKDDKNAITSDGFTMVGDIPDGAYSSRLAESVEKYSDTSVIISSVAALELSGRAQPLLVSSSRSSVYASGDVAGRDGRYCLSAVTTVLDKDGNERGRIVVVPSVYLTATDSLVSGGYSNREFLYSMMQNVFGAEHVPYGCKSIFYSTEVLQNLTMKEARIFTTIIFLIPAAVAVTGTVIIIKRKNR